MHIGYVGTRYTVGGYCVHNNIIRYKNKEDSRLLHSVERC